MKSDEKCEHCDSPVVYPWGSKSWSERLIVNQKYCINCDHNVRNNCDRKKCVEIRAIEEAEKIRVRIEEEERNIRIIMEISIYKMENIYSEDELTQLILDLNELLMFH